MTNKKTKVMKKETIIKRIKKSDLLTKKGEIKKCYERVFNDFVFSPKERHQLKFWRNRGASLSDYTNDYLEVCRVIGLDYIWSNDAPRGGQEGYNIQLTPKGVNQIKDYADYVKAKNPNRWARVINYI